MTGRRGWRWRVARNSAGAQLPLEPPVEHDGGWGPARCAVPRGTSSGPGTPMRRHRSPRTARRPAWPRPAHPRRSRPFDPQASVVTPPPSSSRARLQAACRFQECVLPLIVHARHCPPPDPDCHGRRRPGRVGAPGRRAVDDEHRHRRRGRHRHPGRAARPCRIGAGAHHRQQRCGGGGGPRHPQQARPARGGRPAHRRLPLQRPPAADEVPRGCGGARQVPHQPGQRRHEAARRAVRADHRGRDRERASRCASA